MKKYFLFVCSLLLAGSSFVQSCKKPDATPTSAGPTVPAGPVTPLTEQQIIQKAISRLGTDTFEFKGFNRLFTRRYSSLPEQGNYQAFTSTVDSYNQYGTFNALGSMSTTIGKNGRIVFGFSVSIHNGENTFYSKIFVNAEGDSFIGVFCYHPKTIWKAGQRCSNEHQMSYHNDSAYIVASDFSNMEKYKTIQMDSNSNFLFPKNTPSGEIQYYYNKDSLVLYSAGSTETNSLDTITRTTGINIAYGRKKK